jgi:glycosyltransferase 2 family protein
LIKNIVKLLITIALFAYISTKVDFVSVSKHIERADVPLLLMALILATLSTVLAAYRWRLIMDKLGFAEPARYYFAQYFKGSFFNQALPGSIGGDAVRIMNLRSGGYPLALCVHGVFIDRIVGLVGLLAINLVSILFLPQLLPIGVTNSLELVSLVGLGGFLALIFLHRLPFIQNLKLLSVFVELSKSFYIVYRTAKAAWTQISLSVLVHLFSVLCVFALARAVRLEIDIWTYCMLMPPVFLLMIAPISLAGWGVREGAMVALFGFIGAPKEAILAVSVLYGMTVVVSSLPGAVVWLLDRKKLI